MARSTLGFNINTWMKMITPDLPKITWEVDGDFNWRMEAGAILSTNRNYKEL